MKKAYVDDETVGGMSVRDMVQESHLTLAAYVAKVKWNLWASPVEPILAARHLHLSLAIDVKREVVCQGENPKYMVKLRKQHYMLHVTRRQKRVSQCESMARGGIRPGTWTWEEPSQNPVSISSRPVPPETAREEIPEWAVMNTPLQTVVAQPMESLEPYVIMVDISPSVRTDLISVTSFACQSC